MALSPEDQKAIKAIRARAQRPEDSAELEESMAESDQMEAFLEGRLSIEEINEETLHRYIQALGTDYIINRLMKRFDEQTDSKEIQVNQNAFVQESHVQKLPLRPSWLPQTKGWMAIAASLFVVSTSVFLTNYALQVPPEDSKLPLQLREWKRTKSIGPTTAKPWGEQQFHFPYNMPNLNKTYGGSTMGAGTADPTTKWRLATVLVGNQNGWGSGTLISADGFLLTNYHVIASVAQKAAVSGEVARVEIITARQIRGRITPQDPIMAKLFRVDPKHDLALLKIETPPTQKDSWPHLRLAEKVGNGQICYIIGAESDGAAWELQSAEIEGIVELPKDSGHLVATIDTPTNKFQRVRTTVITTNAEISMGSAGGGLLNSQGELIGVTLRGRTRPTENPKSSHIHLAHVKNFLNTLPTQPEGVPFDPWMAGMPKASLLEPELADGDHDGKVDTLRYQLAIPIGQGSRGQKFQPVAHTYYVNLNQGLSQSDHQLPRLPKGLWGMEDSGGFRFNLFLTIRDDGVNAVGYTDAKGIVREIRIGQSGTGEATLIWERTQEGQWESRATNPTTPLIDQAQLNETNFQRLLVLAGEILETSPKRKQQNP